MLCDDAGCPDGTTIVVRDLFYNTPARMKFLKKDVAEGNAVADVVDKLALTHPEISFRLLRDGRETLSTPGDGKLYSAIHAVYGKEFASTLIPAEYTHAGIGMTGYISKPTAARANRNMQIFIVNGRFVRTKTAMAALSEGYKNSIMVGKFPACVLCFTIPPEQVDVNVHPAKIEVRFTQEKPVFDTVYFGVKTALAQRDSRPVMDLSHKRAVPPAPPAAQPVTLFEAIRPSQKSQSAVPPERPAVERSQPLQVPQSNGGERATAPPAGVIPPLPPIVEPDANLTGPLSFSDATSASYDRPMEITLPAPPTKQAVAPQAHPDSMGAAPAPDAPMPDILQQEDISSGSDAVQEAAGPEVSVRLLGEAFATYILLEAGEELLLIDKHAAHERILFDRLMAHRTNPQPQMLLEPVAVTLAKGEYSALLENLDTVRQAGFDVSDFGSGTLLVRAVPMEIQGNDIPLLMQEIAGKFAESRHEVSLDRLEMDLPFGCLPCRGESGGLVRPGGNGCFGPENLRRPERDVLPARPAGGHPADAAGD